MSKKTLIIIIIAVVAAIGIGGTAYTVSTGVFDPYEQQIRLGYKLMSEGQYEEAILAFDKAISIEAKRNKAYIGKADTYFAENNTDMVALINESLTAGYELTQSDKIIDTYIKIADELIAVEKTDLALELLRLGYETTGNEKLNDKIAEIIDKISLEFLKNLYALFEAGNVSEVKNIMLTEEFRNISSYTTETNPAFYSPTSIQTAKNGSGVGVYGLFIYYGDYANNVRSGQGTWMNIDTVSEYTFEGQWENDKPNGFGEAISINSEWSEINNESGTYKDGLANGIINIDEGNGHVYFVTATNGIVAEVDATAEFKNYCYERDTYPVWFDWSASDGTNGIGWPRGMSNGVWGFVYHSGE